MKRKPTSTSRSFMLVLGQVREPVDSQARKFCRGRDQGGHLKAGDRHPACGRPMCACALRPTPHGSVASLYREAVDLARAAEEHWVLHAAQPDWAREVLQRRGAAACFRVGTHGCR